MATRAQQAAATSAKAERSAALAVIEGQPLPLPTPPRDHPADLTDPALPDELTALGAIGLSPAQIANHLSLTVDELRDGGEGHPELKRALSRARTAAIAWWEEKARRAVVTDNNRFPAGAWSHIMRAQFPEYAEKQAINVNIDLGRLVTLDLRAPQLTGDQLPSVDIPSQINRGVGLIEGPTGSGSQESSLLQDGGPADPSCDRPPSPSR